MLKEHLLDSIVIPGSDAPDDIRESLVSVDGTDLTLIRWMLRMTPEQRMTYLQAVVDEIAEISEQ